MHAYFNGFTYIDNNFHPIDTIRVDATLFEPTHNQRTNFKTNYRCHHSPSLFSSNGTNAVAIAFAKNPCMWWYLTRRGPHGPHRVHATYSQPPLCSRSHRTMA